MPAEPLRRTAVVAAAAATALAVVMGVLWFALVGSGAGLAMPPVTFALVTPLVLGSAAALLRGRGVLPMRAAVLLPVAGAVAGVSAAIAVTLFGLSFDAADEGRRVPPGTDAVVAATALLAWLLIGAVAAGVLAAVLRPAGLPRAARIALGAVVGLVAAPALGVALLAPGGAIVPAAGMLVAALLVGAPRAEAGAAARVPPPPRTTEPDRRAAALALAGAGLALAASVFSFAGGPLGVLGLDGTGAMGAGLGAGATAGLLVVAAAARLGLPRSAALLLAAACVVNGCSRLLGGGDGSTLLLLVSAVLLAAGGALLLRPALPWPARTSGVVAALIALAAVATIGFLVAAAAGFLVPVAGVLVAVRAVRPRRAADVPA